MWTCSHLADAFSVRAELMYSWDIGLCVFDWDSVTCFSTCCRWSVFMTDSFKTSVCNILFISLHLCPLMGFFHEEIFKRFKNSAMMMVVAIADLQETGSGSINTSCFHSEELLRYLININMYTCVVFLFRDWFCHLNVTVFKYVQ